MSVAFNLRTSWCGSSFDAQDRVSYAAVVPITKGLGDVFSRIPEFVAGQVSRYHRQRGLARRRKSRVENIFQLAGGVPVPFVGEPAATAGKGTVDRSSVQSACDGIYRMNMMQEILLIMFILSDFS